MELGSRESLTQFVKRKMGFLLPFQTFPPFSVTYDHEWSFVGPNSPCVANEIISYLLTPWKDVTFPACVLEAEIAGYMEREKVPGATALSLSGGLDSSFVALNTNPDVLYIGCYNEPGFDERPFSRLVAAKLGKYLIEIELTEQDFLDNLLEYLDLIQLPIGGPGGVMEYALMKRVKQCYAPEVTNIVCGLGGDEVFGGYYANELLRQFVFMFDLHDAWPNFRSQREKTKQHMMDLFLAASNYKGAVFDPLNAMSLLEALKIFTGWQEKMLYINLLLTLPTLKHIFEESAKALNLKPLAPLASRFFVFNSRSFASQEPFMEPKQKLRKYLQMDLPEIAQRNDKMGFPIPFHRWHNVQELFTCYAKKFLSRKLHFVSESPYTFKIHDQPWVDRNVWGMVMMEHFLQGAEKDECARFGRDRDLRQTLCFAEHAGGPGGGTVRSD